MPSKRDLVIHYDEQLGKVFFYSTDVENTAAIRARAFDGVCPEVATFLEQPADEAERKLGALVFALIDLNSTLKIGVRDYAAEAHHSAAAADAKLELEAAAGVAEAQHHLSLSLHTSAVKNRNSDDLVRAERLLRAAAAQGNAGAIKTLEDWPVLKAAAERRIGRPD